MEDLRRDESDDICVLDVDCQNYLRNVWLGCMTKNLLNLLGNKLMEELDGINLWMRVSTSIESVLCAVDK